MLTNEIKKGAKMVLKGTGWKATMMDNMKGNIRMANVEGIYTEMGSIYVWDIAQVQNADGQWVGVELTEKQKKDMARVKAAGF